MPAWSLAVLLVIITLLVNLPLGYRREGVRRFSAAWFLWVHLSIPLIIALRLGFGFSAAMIPGTVAGAVIGQYLGGLARRRRSRTR